MAITIGTELRMDFPGGRYARWKVAAIRWAPIAYAEITPVGGGRRCVVHLEAAEQMAAAHLRALHPVG